METQRTPEPGIRWNRASIGLTLINAARQDADADEPFARSSYISGIQYLLDGLPAELAPAEILNLRRRVPQEIRDQRDPPARSPRQRNDINNDPSWETSTHGSPFLSLCQSIIRRISAESVILICFLARLLLPHLNITFARLRQSKFGKAALCNLVTMGFLLTQKLKIAFVALTSTVLRMVRNTGILEILLHVGIGYLIAVMSGISDGLSQSFSVLSGLDETAGSEVQLNNYREDLK